jgi:hypothetical protein
MRGEPLRRLRRRARHLDRSRPHQLCCRGPTRAGRARLMAVREVVEGLGLALGSVAAVLGQRRTRAVWLRALAWGMGAMVAVFVVGQLLLLPARVWTLVAATLLRWTAGGAGSRALHAAFAAVETWLSQLAFVWLPVALVALLRYAWSAPLDALFLTALHEHAPALADVVAARRAASVWAELRRALRRTARSVALGAAVALASTLPLVGRFVAPLSQLYVTVATLGWPVALALVLLPLLLGLPISSLTALSAVLACRSVVRELLEPYLTRMAPDESARRTFFATHGAVLVGFAAPYVLAMSVPLAGPLVFMLAQAAVVVPLAACLDRSPRTPPTQAPL